MKIILLVLLLCNGIFAIINENPGIDNYVKNATLYEKPTARYQYICFCVIVESQNTVFTVTNEVLKRYAWDSDCSVANWIDGPKERGVVIEPHEKTKICTTGQPHLAAGVEAGFTLESSSYPGIFLEFYWVRPFAGSNENFDKWDRTKHSCCVKKIDNNTWQSTWHYKIGAKNKDGAICEGEGFYTC